MQAVDLLEKKIQKNDQAIHTLAIEMEALDRQVTNLLDELNVSAEQLSHFIENEKNFSQENWQELLRQKKALDEKLKRDLDNIRCPISAKKSLQERHVLPHWIFVR